MVEMSLDMNYTALLSRIIKYLDSLICCDKAIVRSVLLRIRDQPNCVS